MCVWGGMGGGGGGVGGVTESCCGEITNAGSVG